jgi:hypothetical protein
MQLGMGRNDHFRPHNFNAQHHMKGSYPEVLLSDMHGTKSKGSTTGQSVGIAWKGRGLIKVATTQWSRQTGDAKPKQV